ncbi:MAG: cytidylate kinase family protein [Candidatus Omnitrophica bacterium]|nr:cytidylate kinase family protein [Candidatus Omnitrophota bacterium]
MIESEARQFIKKEDADRTEYLKKYFGKDIADPLLYDMVLNTDRIYYDDTAVLIGRLVISRMNGEK